MASRKLKRKKVKRETADGKSDHDSNLSSVTSSQSRIERFGSHKQKYRDRDEKKSRGDQIGKKEPGTRDDQRSKPDRSARDEQSTRDDRYGGYESAKSDIIGTKQRKDRHGGYESSIKDDLSDKQERSKDDLSSSYEPGTKSGRSDKKERRTKDEQSVRDPIRKREGEAEEDGKTGYQPDDRGRRDDYSSRGGRSSSRDDPNRRQGRDTRDERESSYQPGDRSSRDDRGGGYEQSRRDDPSRRHERDVNDDRRGGYESRESSGRDDLGRRNDRSGGYEPRERSDRDGPGGRDDRSGGLEPRQRGGRDDRSGRYEPRERSGRDDRSSGYEPRESISRNGPVGRDDRSGGFKPRERSDGDDSGGRDDRSSRYEPRERSGKDDPGGRDDRSGGFEPRERSGRDDRSSGHEPRESISRDGPGGRDDRSGGFKPRERSDRDDSGGRDDRSSRYEPRERSGKDGPGGRDDRSGGYEPRERSGRDDSGGRDDRSGADEYKGRYDPSARQERYTKDDRGGSYEPSGRSGSDDRRVGYEPRERSRGDDSDGRSGRYDPRDRQERDTRDDQRGSYGPSDRSGRDDRSRYELKEPSGRDDSGSRDRRKDYPNRSQERGTRDDRGGGSEPGDRRFKDDSGGRDGGFLQSRTGDRTRRHEQHHDGDEVSRRDDYEQGIRSDPNRKYETDTKDDRRRRYDPGDRTGRNDVSGRDGRSSGYEQSSRVQPSRRPRDDKGDDYEPDDFSGKYDLSSKLKSDREDKIGKLKQPSRIGRRSSDYKFSRRERRSREGLTGGNVGRDRGRRKDSYTARDKDERSSKVRESNRNEQREPRSTRNEYRKRIKDQDTSSSDEYETEKFLIVEDLGDGGTSSEGLKSLVTRESYEILYDEILELQERLSPQSLESYELMEALSVSQLASDPKSILQISSRLDIVEEKIKLLSQCIQEIMRKPFKSEKNKGSVKEEEKSKAEKKYTKSIDSVVPDVSKDMSAEKPPPARKSIAPPAKQAKSVAKHVAGLGTYSMKSFESKKIHIIKRNSKHIEDLDSVLKKLGSIDSKEGVPPMNVIDVKDKNAPVTKSNLRSNLRYLREIVMKPFKNRIARSIRCLKGAILDINGLVKFATAVENNKIIFDGLDEKITALTYRQKVLDIELTTKMVENQEQLDDMDHRLERALDETQESMLKVQTSGIGEMIMDDLERNLTISIDGTSNLYEKQKVLDLEMRIMCRELKVLLGKIKEVGLWKATRKEFEDALKTKIGFRDINRFVSRNIFETVIATINIAIVREFEEFKYREVVWQRFIRDIWDTYRAKAEQAQVDYFTIDVSGKTDMLQKRLDSMIELLTENRAVYNDHTLHIERKCLSCGENKESRNDQLLLKFAELHCDVKHSVADEKYCRCNENQDPRAEICNKFKTPTKEQLMHSFLTVKTIKNPIKKTSSRTNKEVPCIPCNLRKIEIDPLTTEVYISDDGITSDVSSSTIEKIQLNLKTKSNTKR